MQHKTKHKQHPSYSHIVLFQHMQKLFRAEMQVFLAFFEIHLLAQENAESVEAEM